MNRKYAFLGLFASLVLWLGFSANPPNGRTGAPGEGLCSDCHNQTNPPQMGMIVVTGMPATIVPNTQYVLTMTSTMTVDPTGPDTERAGFQLTILNSLDQQAGTITAPSAGSTLQNFNGRQYWEHNPFQTYPANDMVTWTATWTSPTTPANTTITYYAAGNIANGNGSNTGDRIVQTTGGGMLMGGGTNLSVTINNVNHVLCNGQSNGSATAVAEGGSTPYAYSWSNGSSGANLSNVGAGTYTVTVTDNASATASASVTITQPSLLVLNTPNINNLSCNGSNNGSITASASGGVNPYFFQWSNGSTGTTISNLAAGSYTVTVTDDNNCTKTATYAVTQPAVLTINLVNLSHESCAGENDGSITIGATGGSVPYFAEWSNSTIGLTNSGLEPGTYSVTVTDNNDCTKTASYTVNAGGTINVTLLQIQHVTCNGGTNGGISISASGGESPYSYDWSNGSSGASITGLAAGTYLVTISDANGCEVVRNYTVNQPTAINVTIGQTGVNTCFGNTNVDLTAMASGGSPGYTALWSNGITGLTNDNLGAGTYTITVTDMSGCTKTATSVVTQPAQVTVNVVTTDETSSGANNGTATANASGGSPPLTYLWSTGATTQGISGLPPGSYSVTVNDASGCTAFGIGQVNAFGCSINVALGLDVSVCEEDTILLIPSVTGAAGEVTYLWSNGSTGTTLEVTTGGTYCVSVLDAANCAASDCIDVTEIILPTLDCPVTPESAPGANDGAINCVADPAIISWLWNTGAMTPSITALSPGEYCVTVTDSNGCTRTQCFNVQSGNCNLTITSLVTDVLCYGDSTGAVVLGVSGATPPVTFAWSNGASTASISNIVAGIYSVTITDSAGCVETRSFTITEPPAILITVDTVGPVFDFASGLIHITATGGVAPYTYLWTFPDGQNAIDEDLNELFITGYYSVQVTDASGCVVTQDSILVEGIIGVRPSLSFRALKVYPVPADDVLVIELEKQLKEILVLGVDGRLYSRILNPASNKIDVGSLDAGWYILRMTDGESWYIARMVK